MTKDTFMISFIAIYCILLTACHTEENSISGNHTNQQKVDSLLKIMTIDEKIGQLNLLGAGFDVTGPKISENLRQQVKEGKVGAVLNAYTVGYTSELQKLAVEHTRLGIPLLFGFDVIHGHRTIFPIPLAQSCSWNLTSIEHSDRIAASEASAEGINWTFAPMIDISRDPRWGRVAEGPGEDTWLAGKIGAARVKGFQGEKLSDNNTILACVKHFAAYGAPQAGRDYNTVDMSERSLREHYLPAYKACLDAGARTVMTSFNEISGVPATANKWLFTDLLRNEWGFKGFVVTDYTSIYELIPHGVAEDSISAGELALLAGVDMDLQSEIYSKYLKESFESGKVSMDQIDEAVSRILLAKYALGLFDDPYRYCNAQREKDELMTPQSQKFAREFATESCVLLKNSKHTLPIPKNVKKIALIGPLADSKEDMLGSWSAAGRAADCITLLEGLKEKSKQYHFSVQHARGCEIKSSSQQDFNEALQVARSADYIVLALGESRDMSGEAASRTDLSLPGVQMELARQLIALGKPLVVVLFNGRPLTISELHDKAPAILEAWYGGTQAGHAIADLLFADAIPSGKLTMTFPRNVGQIPIHYNVKNSGRPFSADNPTDRYKSHYLDSPNSPLYPFGYGLSYSHFKYKNLQIDKTVFNKNDSVRISVDIENKGPYTASEIVQLYVKDEVGSVTRPLKELKGFEEINILKNETTTVTFYLSADDLKFYDLQMNYTSEPGSFVIYVGPDSGSGLSAKIQLE